MIRRLLDLCLLAYPPARRRRDRDYLRDLALELAQTQGYARQALSLLGGGIRDRIETRRRTRRDIRIWAKRTLVASFVLAALTLGVNGVIGTVGGEGEGVHEVEKFVCLSRVASTSGKGERVDDFSGCAETSELIDARERAGWDCTTAQHMHHGRRSITSECTRGSEVATHPR